MQKQINFQTLLNIIELAPPVLDNRDFLKATQQFEEWKEIVKKQRKILAKKYHPDIGGSIEKMQKINEAVDFLLTIKIERKRPQPRRVVIMRTHFSTSATTSTSTSWTSGGFY